MSSLNDPQNDPVLNAFHEMAIQPQPSTIQV